MAFVHEPTPNAMSDYASSHILATLFAGRKSKIDKLASRRASIGGNVCQKEEFTEGNKGNEEEQNGLLLHKHSIMRMRTFTTRYA